MEPLLRNMVGGGRGWVLITVDYRGGGVEMIKILIT